MKHWQSFVMFTVCFTYVLRLNYDDCLYIHDQFSSGGVGNISEQNTDGSALWNAHGRREVKQ